MVNVSSGFRLDDHPVAFLRPRISFPFSWAGHIPFAYVVIDLVRPRQLVELGTDSGNSYLAFCQAVLYLGIGSRCFAVDTWQGDEHARKYGNDVYLGLRAYHDPLYAGFSELKRSLFADAVHDFPDGSIDLLHIDGLHTYEAVRGDVDAWLPKLSDRAVLLLHDTRVRERGFGVWRVFGELAERFPAFEFTHSNGLGIVQVGSDAPIAFRRFMADAIADPKRMRVCFEELGHTIVAPSGDAPAIVDVVAPDLAASVFCRSTGTAYSESQRLSVQISAASGTQRVAFRLPTGMMPDFLRIDPCEVPGVFGISSLYLETEGADSVRVHVEGLRSRLGFVHCDLLPDDAGDGLRLVAFDRDPYIELDVKDCMARLPVGASVVVHCDLTIDVALTHPRDWALAQHQGHAISELRRLAAEQLDLRALARELARATDVMRERVVVAEQAAASLQGDLAANREQVETLRADARSGRQHEMELATQVAVLQAAAKGAQQREVALVEHDRGLARELDALHASTLWRAFMHLRSTLRRLPGPVRAALRRALEATWWAITPWRIPARLRFIRQRRVAVHGGLTSALQAPPGRSTELAVLAPQYNYLCPVADGTQIAAAVDALHHQTRFSVVVPVYNTDPDLLRRMIASVTQQWYPHWQLILVDDHSSAIGVQQVFAELHDERIVTVRLDTNQRISGATNAGIAWATGDFIVFLDHDDELTSDCLYELALCIDRDGPDYVYSDEDKIDVDGTFRDPFFKPDWSPDTMMSVMLTCHVSCVRRSLALQVGGLRSDYDGSQDWDFVLRATERARRISHISKVLYHWRITPASCASDLQAKPYATDASKRAREDALRRRHLAGEVVPVPQFPGYFRVRYALQGKPLFSIIIPSKDNGAVLDACVTSILAKTEYSNYEIIVVDNGSTDADALTRLADIRQRHAVTVLEHAVPFNYSEINNFGVRHARGSVLVFLNDDTEVISGDWLEYMGGYAQLDHVGAVGAKLLYPGARQVQHVGVLNLAPGPSHAFARANADSAGYFMRNVLEYDWVAVTGACLMVERAKFEACGGFDEDLAVAYNDTALCFSLLERGLYNVVCPGVELIHHESLSRGSDVADPAKLARADKERKIALRKHPAFDGRDPFYNPNLDPNHAQFELRVGSQAFVPVDAASVALRGQPPHGRYCFDALNFRPLGDADPVHLGGRQVTFGGWASDGHGHAADEITLVLSGDTGTYAASTRTCIARPDVAQALHADGLQWSGFCLTASIEHVAPGRYAMYVVKPGQPDAGCKLPQAFVVS